MSVLGAHERRASLRSDDRCSRPHNGSNALRHSCATSARKSSGKIVISRRLSPTRSRRSSGSTSRCARGRWNGSRTPTLRPLSLSRVLDGDPVEIQSRSGRPDWCGRRRPASAASLRCVKAGRKVGHSRRPRYSHYERPAGTESRCEPAVAEASQTVCIAHAAASQGASGGLKTTRVHYLRRRPTANCVP